MQNRKRDTDVQNRLLNSVGEGKGDTHLKSIGTSISVKQQDEKPGHPISSGDES